MPLIRGDGILQTHVSPKVDKEAIEEANSFFWQIDESILQASRTAGLRPSQVQLLRPCKVLVAFSPDRVMVVYTDANAGSGDSLTYVTVPSGTQFSDVERHAQEKLGYEGTAGFSVSNDILHDKAKRQSAATALGNGAIQIALREIEEEARIVRINPIFRGRGFRLDPNSVFTLAPFREPYNRIYFAHIKPTVEAIAGLRCNRADSIADNQAIIEDIWKSINEAAVVLADISGNNPNVFYELGIAHTVGKEVVLLVEGDQRAPFDLTHLRHIRYEDNPPGLRQLEVALTSTLTTILSRKAQSTDGN
jgi:hypothetical protein